MIGAQIQLLDQWWCPGGRLAACCFLRELPFIRCLHVRAIQAASIHEVHCWHQSRSAPARPLLRLLGLLLTSYWVSFNRPNRCVFRSNPTAINEMNIEIGHCIYADFYSIDTKKRRESLLLMVKLKYNFICQANSGPGHVLQGSNRTAQA